MIVALSLGLSLSACDLALPPIDSPTPASKENTRDTSSPSSASSTTEADISDSSGTSVSVDVSRTEATTSESKASEPSETGSASSSESLTTTTPTTTPGITTAPSKPQPDAEPTPKPGLEGIIDALDPNKNDKDRKGSKFNPYAIGEAAPFDGYETIFDPFRAEVVVQNVIRGKDALKMVKDASSINPAPDEGNEYLVAQVLVKITDSKNEEIVGVSPYFFSLAREDGRMYGDISLFRSVTPVLEPLRVGETSLAYITFQVAKDDENPFIVFLSRANRGLWFSTDPDYEGKLALSTAPSESRELIIKDGKN
jgi:hypothetical protein